MTKKKKIILGIILIAVIIGAIVTVIIVRRNIAPTGTEIQTFDTYEEAYEKADFSLQYSDRICGYPATQFKSNSSTIEVLYSDCVITRKTYAVPDNSSDEKEYSESKDYEINEMTVTFKGENGLVYEAVWNFNNYAYMILINSPQNGVAPKEMTSYVEATM